MDFVETHDPFGYVGSRVLRHVHSHSSSRRRARRAAAMKPDPGAPPPPTPSHDGAEGDDEPTQADGLVLHGWLTRYDAALDLYTLFVPGRDRATRLSRAEVIKLVSNPEFQLRAEVDDDAFPPPVEDTSSRFVGAPVRKASGKKKAKRRRSFGSESDAAADAWVDGRVVSYRPFADAYRVDYEDGSTAEMTESEVVDALLAFAKEKAAETAKVADGDAVRKRRRSQNGAQHDDEDDEETEDEALPLLRDAVKFEGGRPPPAAPTPAARLPPPPPQEPVANETAPAQELESTTTAPEAREPPHEVESVAIDDDDEPMELPPIDDDEEEEEEEEEDMRQVNRALMAMGTSASTAPIAAVSSTDIAISSSSADSSGLTADAAPTPTPSLPAAVAATATPPAAYYVVHARPHAATVPLDKRAMAFEFVRMELTRLLDADECANLETALVADVMANRDIKDRDAVRRFVETGGLVVLNTVLNARARDVLTRPALRYDRVLFLLKLLAMLPTPSELHVMESGIGKTVGRLIKARLNDQQTAADAAMPKCIAHLAKWIKHKWIANMRRDVKTNARGGPKKHLQRPTHGRPSGPSGPLQQRRLADHAPIPRRQGELLLPPSPPPGVASFADFTAASNRTSRDVLGGALAAASRPSQPPKSTLKPDWMRQKETLTRTRFTINTDANAERQHYQRDRANAEANASSNASAQTRGPQNARNTAMDDPGARGVYGRAQRLAFGPRWNVCEFFKDTPPTAVRRLNAGANQHWKPKPKSILRKTSRYRNELSW